MVEIYTRTRESSRTNPTHPKQNIADKKSEFKVQLVGMKTMYRHQTIKQKGLLLAVRF
jgi:hypothetical protein